VEILGESKMKNKLIEVEYELIGDADELTILEFLNKIILLKPLSKFGIEPVFKVGNKKDNRLAGFFGYSETNTYSFIKENKAKQSKPKILSKICLDINENDYL